MGHTPNDLDKLLGGPAPARVAAPSAEADGVHCDGLVSIARLIPRAIAWERAKKLRRSVLVR
jgi:hypothetical protein